MLLVASQISTLVIFGYSFPITTSVVINLNHMLSTPIKFNGFLNLIVDNGFVNMFVEKSSEGL